MHKSGVKDPSISTWELAQLDSCRTGNSTDIGVKSSSLFRGYFFTDFILL